MFNLLPDHVIPCHVTCATSTPPAESFTCNCKYPVEVSPLSPPNVRRKARKSLACPCEKIERERMVSCSLTTLSVPAIVHPPNSKERRDEFPGFFQRLWSYRTTNGLLRYGRTVKGAYWNIRREGQPTTRVHVQNPSKAKTATQTRSQRNLNLPDAENAVSIDTVIA